MKIQKNNSVGYFPHHHTTGWSSLEPDGRWGKAVQLTPLNERRNNKKLIFSTSAWRWNQRYMNFLAMHLLPLPNCPFTMTSKLCEQETQIFTFSNINYLSIFILWNFSSFPYTSIVLENTPSTNVPTKDIQHNDGGNSQNVWYIGQVEWTEIWEIP